MSKQGREVKWIPFNLLLNKVIGFGKRIGDYRIVVTSDYGKIIVDYRNFKALLPVYREYLMVEDFERWLKRGFIVIAVFSPSKRYRYFVPQKYYILNAKNGNTVCACNGINTYMFLEGRSDYFR
ncbi:MAG: hypothetical protein ACP5Q5_11375, partial [Brevinematia bacterium]